MFEAGTYRKISGGQDRAAQGAVEGTLSSSPHAFMHYLVRVGIISVNTARLRMAEWDAFVAKARRRSGWWR